jgi:hypothetical protein
MQECHSHTRNDRNARLNLDRRRGLLCILGDGAGDVSHEEASEPPAGLAHLLISRRRTTTTRAKLHLLLLPLFAFAPW